MRRLTVLVLSLILVLTFVTTEIGARGEANPLVRQLISTIDYSIDGVRERLLALVRNGGWCGGTSVPIDCSASDGKPDPDLYGTVAIEMLEACLEGDARFCNSAVQASNNLFFVLNNGPSCDGNPATSNDRISGPDGRHLGSMSRMFVNKVNLLGDNPFSRVGGFFQDCTLKEYPSPADHFEAILKVRQAQGRDAFSVWDGSRRDDGIHALGIALWRLDLVEYAEAMVVYMIEQDHRWNKPDQNVAICGPDGRACQLQAIGALVRVASKFKDNSYIASRLGSYVTLLATAIPATDGTTQRLAYRLQGLATSLDFSTEVANMVFALTARLIVECRLPNGGFHGCPGRELSYVNAEVLEALRLARIYIVEYQKSLGFSI